MPRPPNNNSKLYAFLDQQGLIPNGSAQEIANAKKEYKRAYQRKYRRKQRKERPEVTVILTKAEWKLLTDTATGHFFTLSSYLREAALAYTNQTYIVPNQLQIAEIQQRIRLLQSDIQLMVKWLDRLRYHELKDMIPALIKRIMVIESQLVSLITRPKRVSDQSTRTETKSL